jgi:hypothetical protein
MMKSVHTLVCTGTPSFTTYNVSPHYPSCWHPSCRHSLNETLVFLQEFPSLQYYDFVHIDFWGRQDLGRIESSVPPSYSMGLRSQSMESREGVLPIIPSAVWFYWLSPANQQLALATRPSSWCTLASLRRSTCNVVDLLCSKECSKSDFWHGIWWLILIVSQDSLRCCSYLM